MADTRSEIQKVISSDVYKGMSPEGQKALLLKAFPDSLTDSTTVAGEDSSTPSVPPTPKSWYDTPLYTTSGEANRGYREHSTGTPGKPTVVTPRTIGEELPGIAAMLATMYPPIAAATAFPRVGAAILGGLAGKAAQVGVEKAADAPPSPPTLGERFLGATSTGGRVVAGGLSEGLLEVFSLGAGKAVGATGKALKNRYLPDTPEFRLLEQASANMPKKLKPQEISPIPTTQEKKLKGIESQARDLVEKNFGPYLNPTDAGRTIADINLVARDVARKQATINFAPVNELKVDLTPHAELLAAVDSKYLPYELEGLLWEVKKAKAKFEAPETVIRAAENAIRKNKELREVPLPTIQRLRSNIQADTHGLNKTTITTNEAELLRQATAIGSALEDVAAKAGKVKEWKFANDEYEKTVGELFHRGIGGKIEKIGLSDPHKIVDLIGPKDRTAVEQVYKIFDLAAKGGKEAAMRTNAAAREFERTFLDEKILNAPIGRWAAHIDSAGKDVVELVMQKDPAAAKNLFTFSEAAKRLAPDGELPADVVAILAQTAGVNQVGFHAKKNILRDTAMFFMPNVHQMRWLVNAMEDLGSKQLANKLRGARIIAAMSKEAEMDQPPAPAQ